MPVSRSLSVFVLLHVHARQIRSTNTRIIYADTNMRGQKRRARLGRSCQSRSHNKKVVKIIDIRCTKIVQPECVWIMHRSTFNGLSQRMKKIKNSPTLSMALVTTLFLEKMAPRQV